MASRSRKIYFFAKEGTSPFFTFQKLASIYAGGGIETFVIDPRKTGVPADANLVISHNLHCLRAGEPEALTRAGAKIVSLIDTPLNKYELFQNLHPEIALICTDAGYIPLVKQMTSDKIRIIDHPLEITMLEHAGERKPISERKIDVLFVGRLQTYSGDHTFSFVEKYLAPRIARKAFQPGDTAFHEIADKVIRPYRRFGLYRNPALSDRFLNYSWYVSHIVRRWRKIHVLREMKMAEQGKHFALVSNDEKQLRSMLSDRHSFYNFMPWTEVLELMKDSKMVINTMPNHMDCLHEHLVEAMFAGAVCLTDVNKMIARNFTHGKDILTFNYERGNLAGVLNTYLGERKDELQSIADHGYAKIATLVNDGRWFELLEKLEDTGPDRV